MTSSTKAALASLLHGVAWFLFVLAALVFWCGGRAISEFANIGRMLAEVEGIGLTILFGGLGAIVKIAADSLEGDETNISLSDSLRK